MLSKPFLLFLFVMGSFGVRGQWNENGGGCSSPFGWIENFKPGNGPIPENVLDAPFENGVNKFGVLRTWVLVGTEEELTDAAYYAYLKSNAHKNLCVDGHTDPENDNDTDLHQVCVTGYEVRYSVDENALVSFGTDCGYGGGGGGSNGNPTTPDYLPDPTGGGGSCLNPPKCPSKDYKIIDCKCELVCANKTTACPVGTKKVDCDCKPFYKWYADIDNDGFSSTLVETFALVPHPGPQYKTGSPLGPDCDDNNAKINKLNSCRKCVPEPANGDCREPCKTSKEDLIAMFPNNGNEKNLETLANTINKYALDLGIDSKLKLQHLLSQTGHETGGFKTLQVSENLKYSTASFIPKSYSKFTTDPVKEPTKLDAKLYINNAEKLANAAMCCKFKNGDEASGDGWKYRGRGIMQLTWKSNYLDFQTWYNNKYNPDLDFVNNPDLISNDDNLAVLSGMWYFKKRVLDKIKDFDNKATLNNVTVKINEKKKGLKDREKKLINAQKLIDCRNK